MTEEDIKKMKVAQLRQFVLETEEMGYSQSDIANMNKGELVDAVMSYQAMLASEQQKSAKAADFDVKFEHEEKSVSQPNTLQEMLPKYGSKEWKDYVLGMLNPDEMSNGCPRMCGLRRVAQIVLGDIVFSGAQDVSVINQDDGRAVTVNYRFDIAWKLDFGMEISNFDSGMPVRTFMGIADCTENVDCLYARHPAATAETKAMARALKTALSINVLTADEQMSGHKGKAANAPAQNKKVTLVTDSLATIIENHAKNASVDLVDITKQFCLEENIQEKTLRQLSVEQGKKLYAFIDKSKQDVK